jgi:transaldolase
MKATRIPKDLGQSLWLDNITRNLLKTGGLRRYIDEFLLTGMTSNPMIFDHAIKNSGDYDDAIKSKLAEGKSGEQRSEPPVSAVFDGFVSWGCCRAFAGGNRCKGIL